MLKGLIMSRVPSKELSALNAKLNCLVFTYKKVLPVFQSYKNGNGQATIFDPISLETMEVMGRCFKNLEDASYLISCIMKHEEEIKSIENITFVVKDDDLLKVINNYRGNVSNMLYIYKELLQIQIYI
ncbi:hypothetical protein phiOC_p161 [Ochrobactrum phage vB_OspM_OC]|nr:hypothetical protein phiOC_p161 [Ochrobactrum phage vB_OspM_OC]